MTRNAAAITRSIACLGLLACGPRPAAHDGGRYGVPMLPDVRVAPGRPPVVLVARDGDPVSAVAIAVTTAGIGFGQDPPDGEDPEVATALAGVVESRLEARHVEAAVTPAHDGLRASVLATSEAEAARVATALRDALDGPATEADLAPARRKLAALAQRPLRDRALARWARCVGEPLAPPERATKGYADLDLPTLERWRSAGLGLGRVAISVTGPAAVAETVARTVLRGAAWSRGASLPARREPPEPHVEVFEVPDPSRAPIVHATLDVGTSSAAVTTAEALGDPRGPLAARLSELDLPFSLREVTGAAHAGGGCVGVVLEAAPAATASANADLAARVADAVALVRLEAGVHVAELGATRDGRALARRSGDAREAAERAAWWGLADLVPAPRPGGGSVALGVPSRRGAKESALEPSREALASAVARATTAWDERVVDARSRVERGQGEAWVLVASPCGTEGESDVDAGLTALFVASAAEIAQTSSDVRVEPWVVADGAGLLVHGPALAGETPAAHARRLADVAARSLAAEPITGASIARARADLFQREARGSSATLAVLGGALAPRHPSWVVPWGSSEPLARSSDAAVRLRAQSLRAGPLRVAVLANASAAQADAAVRAADRWVARRASGARTCPAPTAAEPPTPGTYAAPHRPGSVPEAWIAFPFAPGDEVARDAASLLASALDGDKGLLERALGGGAPLVRESDAKVIGWPRAPALVLRLVAAETSLDAAVMQTRALVDRIRVGGLAGPELERASAARGRSTLRTALDPRARVVATWRGGPIDGGGAHVTAEGVRAFAERWLTEDAMVIVASRPARPPAVAP